jgi:hypothetical protein
LVENYSFETIEIDLDTLTVTTSSSVLSVSDGTSGATEVLLNGETVITISEDNYGVTIDSTAPAETLIEYALYGGYSQTVTLYSKKDFKLSLNSVTIESNDGPAINIQSNDRAFVELTAGSVNTLSDGTTWSDRLLPDGEEMDLKGTVFSEGGLIISGSGGLNVTANTKHAIASDDHARLREGDVVLTVNEKTGIRVNDAFVMDGGDLEISASSGKGIMAEGREDDTTPLCFVTINDGNLDITSSGKAIAAAWESEDGDTSTTADDPDPRITINGGAINIKTSGEGLESKSDILINAGELLIDAADDGINGLGSIEINGGYIAITSSTNDAVDANGPMTINGGVIVAHGAGVPEGGLDNDQSTFAVTGGIFVAFGGRNSTPTTSATTQNSVALGSISSGLLTVKDNSGNIAIAYEMPESGSVLVTSPDFQTGTTYSIYNGGQIGSYSENFNGLYLDPESHSNGSEGESFTISSTVTNLGNDSDFNPGPPGRSR